MKKRILLLAIVLSLIIFTFVSCSPTTAITTTTTTTKTPVPEGSVLKYEINRVSGQTFEEGSIDYRKYTVTAKIMNVGDDGNFFVNVEITPKALVYDGKNADSIKVWMRKGEEKTFTFDYWIVDYTDYNYKVWCSATRYLGTPPTTTKTTTTTTVETWKTFTSTAYGYSFQYPSSWTFQESSTADTDLIISKGSALFSVSSHQQKNPALTVSDYVDSAIEVDNSHNPLVYNILLRTNLNWQNTYQACFWALWYQWQSDSPLYKSANLYILHNGYLHLFKWAAYDSEYGFYSTTIDSMINSILFIR